MVPKYFSTIILFWAGTLLSVSVSGSCFNLLSLTSAYGVPSVAAKLTKVWTMGLSVGHK